MTNRSTIGFDGGSAASHVENYAPDLAFFNLDEEPMHRPNRLPGDIKSSFKWSSNLLNSGDPRDHVEYRQALGQVDFYMDQHDTRYGYILTDQELVAFRRIDDSGRLELAEPIPWTTSGTLEEPQLTVLLALWYQGMLASEDNAGIYS